MQKPNNRSEPWQNKYQRREHLPRVAFSDNAQPYDPIHRKSDTSEDVLFDLSVFLVRVEVQI